MVLDGEAGPQPKRESRDGVEIAARTKDEGGQVIAGSMHRTPDSAKARPGGQKRKSVDELGRKPLKARSRVPDGEEQRERSSPLQR